MAHIAPPSTLPPYATLSGPRDGAPERPRWIEEARRARTRTSVTRFLAHAAVELAAHTDGVVELFERWCAPGHDAPHAALAHLESCVATAGADVVVAAARAAAIVCAHGEPGEWRAHFATPVRLRWSTLLTPSATDVHVRAHGDHVELSLTGRAPMSIAVSAGVARADTGEQLPACEMRRRSVVLLPPWAHDTLPRGLRVDPSSASSPTLIGELTAALALLREGAPYYVDWVDAVVHEIIPIEGGGMMRSGTHDTAPGVINASFGCPPAGLGELLVHEASHQYFRLAEQWGPVHDASDSDQYWSPALRTQRPIDAILLTYHAFANIMLYYEDCLSAGLDAHGYCAANKRQWWSEIEKLQRPLETSRALTPIGDALWRPLAERLAAVKSP